MIFFHFTLQGKTGSHFEPKTIPPPLTNKADWEINPLELDFTKALVIGKVSSLETSLTQYNYLIKYQLSLVIYYTSLSVLFVLDYLKFVKPATYNRDLSVKF